MALSFIQFLKPVKSFVKRKHMLGFRKRSGYAFVQFNRPNPAPRFSDLRARAWSTRIRRITCATTAMNCPLLSPYPTPRPPAEIRFVHQSGRL